MTERKVSITECSNGYLIQFEEWNGEEQQWKNTKPMMVFQSFDVMVDMLGEERQDNRIISYYERQLSNERNL